MSQAEAWATREIAELCALPKFCSWRREVGQRTRDQRGGEWGGTHGLRWPGGGQRQGKDGISDAS